MRPKCPITRLLLLDHVPMSTGSWSPGGRRHCVVPLRVRQAPQRGGKGPSGPSLFRQDPVYVVTRYIVAYGAMCRGRWAICRVASVSRTRTVSIWCILGIICVLVDAPWEWSMSSLPCTCVMCAVTSRLRPDGRIDSQTPMACHERGLRRCRSPGGRCHL